MTRVISHPIIRFCLSSIICEKHLHVYVWIFPFKFIFAKVKTKLPTIVLLLIDTASGCLEITENVSSFLRKCFSLVFIRDNCTLFYNVLCSSSSSTSFQKMYHIPRRWGQYFMWKPFSKWEHWGLRMQSCARGHDMELLRVVNPKLITF